MMRPWATWLDVATIRRVGSRGVLKWVSQIIRMSWMTILVLKLMVLGSPNFRKPVKKGKGPNQLQTCVIGATTRSFLIATDGPKLEDQSNLIQLFICKTHSVPQKKNLREFCLWVTNLVSSFFLFQSGLVVSTPLEKYEFVSWDHYSQYMESHNIPWFQTTNQYIYIIIMYINHH